MDKNQAVLTIHAFQQRQMQRGAVDVENGQFKTILDRLGSGEITPTEAITQAYEIDKERQDYY